VKESTGSRRQCIPLTPPDSVLVAESRGEARPEAAAHLAREGGRPRRARSREQERRVRGGGGGGDGHGVLKLQ
jgi:hypothetical protein